MKKIKKILSLAVVLASITSAVPSYAENGVSDLSQLMYSGLTEQGGDECSAVDAWTPNVGGTNTVEVLNDRLVITKNDSSNARASLDYKENVQGELYIETKLATSGKSRMEIFSQKTLMTYVDFDSTAGTVTCNKGIKPDIHTTQYVDSLSQNSFIVLGLHMSASRDTFDVYVDGVLKIKELPMRSMGDYEALSSIRFTSMNVGDTTTVDYVRLYSVDKAETSAPSVSNLSVTGIPAYGRVVEASYVFEDADGDSEGESIYQWYIADSEGGSYAEIEGATRKVYPVKTSDTGKYLKYSVTPVDILGTAGEAVQISSPIAIISTKNIIYTSAFDDKDTWTAGGSGTNKIAEIASEGETEKYLKVGTSAKDSYGQMTKALDFTGNFSIEFDAKVPTLKSGANRTYLLIMKQKTSAGNKDIMQINYYDNDKGETVIRAITSGGNKQNAVDLSDWKRIKIDVNMASKTMTMYVNGVTYDSWKNMPTNSADCTADDSIVSMIVGMTAANTTENADIRIKDIEISQVTSYNTAPMVEELEVKGYAAVGAIMSADYIYTDAEEDIEAENTVEWHMAGSANGNFKKIEGLYGKNIVVPADCAGSYIKAVVVPRDYYGLEGEPVESEAFYVDYLESDSQITVKDPRAVSATTGTVVSDAGSHTFTATDATQNRWIFDHTAFDGNAVMSFKVKNNDAINARVCIPNTQFGYFEFASGQFKYIGASTITIDDTIDKNHVYDIKLIFTGLTGQTSDYAHLYVDGVYLGKVNTRQANVTSLSGVNIYTTGAGSITISDFSIVNISDEYPGFMMVSEDLMEPVNAGEPYEYSAVVRNASGTFKDATFVLAVYAADGGKLEVVDVYDGGLDLGDTSIYLSATPTNAGEFYAKIIKLDSFNTLKPLVIE